MEKQSFASPEAAPAVGPYSAAVAAGDLVFVSGQLALDADGELAAMTAADQARKALANVRAHLAAAGLTLADVVKTTIFLTDIAEFGAVNEVYGEFFTAPFPARSCVQVAALPKGARIEIEAIAAK